MYTQRKSIQEEPLLPVLGCARTFPVYSAANKRNLPIPRKSCTVWKRTFGIALLVGFLAGFYAWVQSHVLPNMRLEILHALKESEIKPLTKYWHEILGKLVDENSNLTDSNHKLKLAETTQRTEEIALKEVDDESQHKIEVLNPVLHKGIQQLSKRTLMEKFGEGPHRVQVQLAFNPNGPDLQGTGDSFVIEMAPSDDMPHTVLWFLEQVDAGLYNGCSFQPAAAHVVMGGAAGNFLSEPDFHPRRRFLESEFPSVLFPEYSSNFPHVKYTLGLAGPSPGGPDFFVNAQDNSIDHTDPCFAKVIDGFETVDRMHQTPGGDEAASMIAIVAMRIIPRN